MISLNIAQNDTDLLVVTENGYGKRTRIDEYPVKGRGGLGVKTVQLTEARASSPARCVVRDGYQVMLISDGGTVIRIPVEDIKRLGRATQGVIVMRLRGDEKVSTLAPVVESEGAVADNGDDGELAVVDGEPAALEPAGCRGRCRPTATRFSRSEHHFSSVFARFGLEKTATALYTFACGVTHSTEGLLWLSVHRLTFLNR